MGIGFFPPRGHTTTTINNITNNLACVDFIINSQAELETQFPNVAGVHTLDQDGVYCFGEFTMTNGRKIVVPTGTRVLFMGHGPSSVVTGNIADSLFEFQSGSNCIVRDFTIVNTNGTSGSAVAIESESLLFQMHDMRFSAPGAAGFRSIDGFIIASNIYAWDCNVAINLGGTNGSGESHWTNLRIENVDFTGVGILGGYSSFMWVGGRADNDDDTLDAITVQAGAGVVVGDVSVVGVEFQTWDDVLKYNSGNINRASLTGCSAAGDVTTLVDWPAASIPSDGLSITGNVTSIAGANFIQGHTTATLDVDYKGNSVSGGIYTETPIVP